MFNVISQRKEVLAASLSRKRPTPSGLIPSGKDRRCSESYEPMRSDDEGPMPRKPMQGERKIVRLRGYFSKKRKMLQRPRKLVLTKPLGKSQFT
ncbi:hypothetical protein V1477_004741 [Vespula maculifrons]|uniref:Uncharacterized protein n=1 Tax=Vespula maculifrons TaxID=7453 RepID=A0ABD2CMY2_VESMC